MRIPFVDLGAMHEEVPPTLTTALNDTLERSAFVGWDGVVSFEADFAAYCGVKHAVACASGTEALRLALLVGGVRPADGVTLAVT